MESLISDLRHALRTFLRQPGYAAVSVLILALGIGANTALFSIFSAAVLAPLPYPEPERLIDLLATHPRHGGERVSITPADFLAWRGQSHAFAQLGAYVPFGSLDLTGAGDPRQLSRHLVSPGLLAALRVEPALGRRFAAEEYRAAGPPAVLLGHKLWRSRFGADPAIVGRSLTLSGRAYTVIGVLPASFRIPGGDPDLLLPLVFRPGDEADRKAAYLGAIGRLAPGVSLGRAREELDRVCHRLTLEHPEIEGGLGASLVPLPESFIGPARQALWLLLAAVGLVLLIACADVANLQLVRASARGPESALRRALGASSLQLMRPLLVESGVLALAGGVLGLPLAELALHLLPDPRGVYLPKSLRVGVDLRVLGFAFLLCLLSALMSAVPSVFKAARERLQPGLRVRASPGRRRLQGGLVVAGVALSFVLLTGAALLVRGFSRLLDRDPGFDSRGRLTFDLALPASRYPDARRSGAFYRELVERLGRLPGVLAVGAAKEIPPEEPWSFTPKVAGEPSIHGLSLGWEAVAGNYFAAMGTPVLRGRAPSSVDLPGSPLVAVLNASAARRLLGGREPLGRRVRFNGHWFEVVGVVGDHWSPGQGEEPEPMFYLATSQASIPPDLLHKMTLVVHAAGNPHDLARPILGILHALDPSLPAVGLGTLEERQSTGLAFGRSRFDTVLLGTFAGLALFLAALGLYGVLAYLVAERTHEMGVRMALGARPLDLIELVLGQGMALAIAGLAAGLPGAYVLTRILASRMAGMGGAHPATYTAAALALLVAAIAACVLPARRAGRLAPAEALRAN